jgi:uncharacterized membrane protein
LVSYGAIRGIGPHENVVNEIGVMISNIFLIFGGFIIFIGFFFIGFTKKNLYFKKHPIIISKFLFLTIILTEMFLIKSEFMLSIF